MTTMTATGLSLKLQRVARDVKAQDLAARMNVSNSTVSRIESSRVVSDERAAAYLAALATFRTVANDGTDAPQAASAA
jgi:transcriptional regulator with XRE-family HTH domain